MMVHNKCEYNGCHNNRRKNPDLHFFRFPADPHRSHIWIQHSGNDRLNYIRNLREHCICQLHFPPRSFLNDNRARLNKFAIPFKYRKDGMFVADTNVSIQRPRTNNVKYFVLDPDEITITVTRKESTPNRSANKMQAVMSSLVNTVPDEESDENVSLDLRVSDTEDIEYSKDDDIPKDVEDEILDKYNGESDVKTIKSVQNEKIKDKTEKNGDIKVEGEAAEVGKGDDKIIENGHDLEFLKVEAEELPTMDQGKTNEVKHQTDIDSDGDKTECEDELEENSKTSMEGDINSKNEVTPTTCDEIKYESNEIDVKDEFETNDSSKDITQLTKTEEDIMKVEILSAIEDDTIEKMNVDHADKISVAKVESEGTKPELSANKEQDDMEIDEDIDALELVQTLEKSETIEDPEKKEEDSPEPEDLLLVLDQKEPEEEQVFDEDESSSDKTADKELKTSEETSEATDDGDDTKQDDETPSEDAQSNEDLLGDNRNEEPMEIEEGLSDRIDIVEHSNIDTTLISENEGPIVIEKEDDDDDDVTVIDDENKENETDKEENRSVLEAILSANKVKGSKTGDGSKSTKRQLNEPISSDEIPKKIKLVAENGVKELKKLNNFKKFMQDKQLKQLTRDQLEELCIQKMCESIIQKSEIGDLKLKIKAHEQMLDILRKEVMLLSKQTRDLNIVHQRVIQDVTKIQENSDKPLIVPKITRSVGLQAVVREEVRRKISRSPALATPNKSPAKPIPSNTTPNNRQSPAARIIIQSQKPTTPQTPVNRSKPTTPVSNGTKRVEKGASVIDLTDEDDKRNGSATLNSVPLKTVNGTAKVNMINAPNGHKFVLMPNGQTMMVKLATTNNTTALSQPILRTVQTNGSAVVRTVGSNQVRTSTGSMKSMGQQQVRGRTSNPVQNRGKQQQQQQQQQQYQTSNKHPIKHPAPLPIAPAPRSDIISAKPYPPKPILLLNKTTCGTGIILSWKMPYNLDMFEEIASYQLYAYQETKSEPRTDSWGKIGDVKALELPMAVTLTQFAVGNRYYFAVRAVDVLTRHGQFSDYQTILL